MRFLPYKLVAATALVLMTGCAATPMSADYTSHFASAAESEEHGKCMAEHAPFNNRQLMFAPNAVQSAWTYCIKQSEIWYPGKPEAKTQPVGWKK